MVRGPRSSVVGLDGARRAAGTGGLAAADGRRFYSILFARPDDRIPDDAVEEPEFFADLNCDQIVEAITAGKNEYDLKPFFFASLQRADAIRYRHEVMQDLEQASVRACVLSFAAKMGDIREHLVRATKAYYREQKQAWFLDAVDIYCDAINAFVVELSACELNSRGFFAFRDYLAAYACSSRFNALLRETKRIRTALSTIEYCVAIKGSSFMVRNYEKESDYSADVDETFAKFKQGAVNDYKLKLSSSVEMNHVEAKIAEFVSKLNPDVFTSLGKFCSENVDFIDREVVTFDREVQFYVAYLEYCAPLKSAGLPFCYPTISDTSRDLRSRDAFDVALARKLGAENSPIVCNHFYLTGPERILVVSGPNQGGKTTFARMFGQLHYLASVGCPVPGSEAQLLLFDRLFTHFEKQERVENVRGKLEDDLLRIRSVLGQATSRSIIIMNEVFTSTTVQDETFLSKKIMSKIIRLGALCVWVTFVDELASFGPEIVSMTSTVAPENPAVRTFKVIRRPADGLAYAIGIAQKHRVTHQAIRERLAR
jgi:DNA mismatch repair protein MutS